MATSPLPPGQPPAPKAPELSIQLHIKVTLDSDGLFNGREPMKLITHALHFAHQPSDLVINSLSYLLARSPYLPVNSAKLIIQGPSQFAQLPAGFIKAVAIAGDVRAPKGT